MLRQRFENFTNATPAVHLQMRVGSMRGYHALAAHHYRSSRPATVARILTLSDPRLSVDARMQKQAGNPTPVGVLVESRPVLNCAMRDAALGDRYGSWLCPKQRAALINAEVRTISRVIIDPRWRGLGLSVRLVQHALATRTTPVNEALAAMGHVCPFFARAGMRAFPRPPHAHDQRLLDALQHVGQSLDLAASEWVALADADRRFITRELRRWTRQAARGKAPDEPAQQLALARQRLRFAPVYYIHCQSQGSDTQPPHSTETTACP